MKSNLHVASGLSYEILWTRGELLLDLLEHHANVEKLEPLKHRYTPITFELGHSISPEKSDTSIRHDSLSDLYVLCQGTVRVLCQPAAQARECTVQRLEPGSVFGADQFFIDHPLSYRAIAASSCQILIIPRDELQKWVEENQSLREFLTSLVKIRQQILFFRLFTDLHGLPSNKLKQLTSYLNEQTIPQNTIISGVCQPNTGCFWLRDGRIDCQSDPPPIVGTRWGTHAPAPDDWIAVSDLQVYHLPIHYWNRAKAIIPTLDAQSSSSGTSQNLGSAMVHPSKASLSELPNRSQIVERSPTQKSNLQVTCSSPAIGKAPTVLFPKPIHRHVFDAIGRYPWIEQQSSSDCGAACLAMICQYWGKRFPLYELRERANVGRSGASLKSLAKAADSIGFQSRPVRASLGRLVDQENPWIAHWEGDHYIVVFGVRNDRLIVSDPAVGRHTISKQEFASYWTGYGLLLTPTEQFRDTKIKQSSFSRYLHVLAPYRGVMVQIIVASLLIQMFSLVTPLFTQIILDTVVVQKSINTLNVFTVGLLLFGLGSIFLSSVRQYLLSYFSNRLDLTLISGFIHHTLSLPLSFFESRRVGDIVTRVQENQKIQEFLVGRVILAWLSVLTGFVYLALMLYYNWQLTVLIVAMIPPIILLTLIATPFLRRVSREIFKESAAQNSSLVEMLSGIFTVKSMAVEQEVRWRWENNLTQEVNATFKGQKLGIGLETVNGVINSVGNTALLWFGAMLVIQDQLTIGQFVAFNMMLGYVINPVVELANLWDELQEVFIAIERLDDVFTSKPETLSQQGLMVMPQIRGEVCVENVTFRYTEDNDRNVLQNISFTVHPGQTVAIVGRSGSGKSTLVKLLEGLYAPTGGRIMIDGHDIHHVSPPSLRSQIGSVPQDCFLFSGTIFDNITLYRADVNLEQVVDVAKLAEAHVFIQSLPLGYNTKVGERGSNLSGGQRQRIAIARALLGNPPILILDEATSALDTESEQRFQSNLEDISRDRTTFIIAHRLSTVRNADSILVLDQGVLAEQGTHRELIEQQGIYATLAQQQLNL
ncbi:MAG: peptidase domain-containing ABC transporter [Cyanobacteria bacterium P01_A01_bin.37]